MIMTRFYFAYGSNMNPRQMATRCPAAQWLGRVSLKGCRFAINRRGVATLADDSRSVTHGVLWKITPRCEASLDRHEGVAWGYYEKWTAEVMDAKGRSVEALVYIDPDCGKGSPRPGYLETIMYGARLAGIPLERYRKFTKEAERHAA